MAVEFAPETFPPVQSLTAAYWILRFSLWDNDYVLLL